MVEQPPPFFCLKTPHASALWPRHGAHPSRCVPNRARRPSAASGNILLMRITFSGRPVDVPRIVIPDDEPAVMSPSAAYGRLAGCDVRTYDDRPSSSDELAARIRDAEIVINIRATSKFTAHVLDTCPQLRLISIWGTGTDNVDLGAARRRGVSVTNTPGVSAVAVAEHTLALILAVAKQ